MTKNNTSGKAGIRLPWHGYLFIILVYVSPSLFLTPIGLLSGIFSAEEMGIIFSNPVINILNILIICAAIAMTLWEKSYLAQYTGTPESIKKTNAKLKLTATLNIAIPILLQIVEATALNISLRSNDIHLRAFMGRSPTAFLYMLLLGSLFDIGLLFYVLQVRIIEPRLTVIPFNKKELTLDIVQRNVLTITFGLLGAFFLVMVVLNPQNLDAG